LRAAQRRDANKLRISPRTENRLAQQVAAGMKKCGFEAQFAPLQSTAISAHPAKEVTAESIGLLAQPFSERSGLFPRVGSSARSGI